MALVLSLRRLSHTSGLTITSITLQGFLSRLSEAKNTFVEILPNIPHTHRNPQSSLVLLVIRLRNYLHVDHLFLLRFVNKRMMSDINEYFATVLVLRLEHKPFLRYNNHPPFFIQRKVLRVFQVILRCNRLELFQDFLYFL